MSVQMSVARPCRTCGDFLPEGAETCPQDGTPAEYGDPSGVEKTAPRIVMPTTGRLDAEDSSEQSGEAWEATVAKDFLVGKQIGEYVVRRRIGNGGMGVVYEGEHPAIGRKVAIKILRPDASEGVRSRELLAEARAASAIRHRGIIDIFGFGTLKGVGQYLVMEYLNGRPLDEVIMDQAPMPPGEVIRILDEVLAALSAAHAEGVIHRDLKPGNIFLVRESNGSVYVKVLDFGLAKRSEAPGGNTPQTRASMIVGTPEYMAPEQACGQPVGPRTDLYAVGIIAFEMLTGRMPFQGQSAMEVAMQQVQSPPPAPSSLVPDMAPELEELILRLLAKKPAQRPASAEAVRRELKAIARRVVDATVLAAAPQAPEAPEQDKARRPVAAVTREAPEAISPSSIEQTAVPVTARGARAAPPVLLAAEPRSASRSPTTEVIAAPRRPPVVLWVGVSVLALLLGAGGAFWMTRSQAPVPVLPPPAVVQAPPVAVPANPTPPPPVVVEAPVVQPPPLAQPTPSQPPVETRQPPVQASGVKREPRSTERAKGTLRLKLDYKATVVIDDGEDVKLVINDLPPSIALPPGEYFLDVGGNPEFERYQQEFVIREGQVKTIRIDNESQRKRP
jgi:serine/threonine-protein kinase